MNRLQSLKSRRLNYHHKKNLLLFNTCFVGACFTSSLLQYLTQEAEARLRLRMTSIWNDKCSEWHVFRMTSVWTYICSEDFVINVFIRKYYFASNAFQVFFKTPARSSGIHRYTWRYDKIIGSAWKKRTNKQTDTRTSANYYMDTDPKNKYLVRNKHLIRSLL